MTCSEFKLNRYNSLAKSLRREEINNFNYSVASHLINLTNIRKTTI